MPRKLRQKRSIRMSAADAVAIGAPTRDAVGLLVARGEITATEALAAASYAADREAFAWGMLGVAPGQRKVRRLYELEIRDIRARIDRAEGAVAKAVGIYALSNLRAALVEKSHDVNLDVLRDSVRAIAREKHAEGQRWAGLASGSNRAGHGGQPGALRA